MSVDALMKANKTKRWTEEEDALLKEKVLEGISFGVMERTWFVGRTRSALIGRAHRMGFTRGAGKRASVTLPKKHGVTTPKKHRGARVEKQRLYIIAGDLDFEGGDGRLLSGRDQCRYIKGDPKIDWQMCGAKTKEGSSYCHFHHSICYKPSEERKTNGSRRKAKEVRSDQESPALTEAEGLGYARAARQA